MKSNYQGLGKTEDGREFPLFNGELLSWSIGSYHTFAEQELGFPRMRTVIQAMLVHRPEQVERARLDCLKGSFDRMFGHNAARELRVIESEIARARGVIIAE